MLQFAVAFDLGQERPSTTGELHDLAARIYPRFARVHSGELAMLEAALLAVYYLVRSSRHWQVP